MNKKLYLIVLGIIAVLIFVGIIFLWPSEEEIEEIEFDYDFMWNVTEDLCNVVHNEYKDNEIRKGRAFGTKGDDITSHLLRRNLINNCSFDSYDVQVLSLGPINSKPRWYYTSKVETINYQLLIDHENYPYNSIVPKNETFVFPSAWDPVNQNYTFDTVRIEPDSLLDNYPFGGSYTGYFYNVSLLNMNGFESLNSGITSINTTIIGIAEYIPVDESVPDEQEGKVFLIDEVEGCEEKLEEITNAAVFLIYNDSMQYSALISKDFVNPIRRISQSDNNLSKIKDLLGQGRNVIVDNVLDINTFTFTYNLLLGDWPLYEHMRIARVPTPDDDSDENIVHHLGKFYGKTIFYKCLNVLHPLRKCRGFILYDSYEDTHIMCYTNREWIGFSPFGNNIIPLRVPALPSFSVNGSVGSWLIDYYADRKTTISGFINQRFVKEKHAPNWEAGVYAYNVEGRIQGKDSSKTVIISNRFDGWWGECPGDSGAGAGIVLAIAKYFKDNQIIPKYNLVFLETTGEEYGFRGATHYRDSHPDENFILWIGTDQLAFNQEGTVLAPLFSKNESNRQIVWNIAEDLGYEERTGYEFVARPAGESGGAEDVVWREKCDTICFVKDIDRSWINWHKAGNDFSEGDVLENIDRDDLNVTAELVLETVKHFTIEEEKEDSDYTIILILISFLIIIFVVSLFIFRKELLNYFA